jgi:hypothetical protein
MELIGHPEKLQTIILPQEGYFRFLKQSVIYDAFGKLIGKWQNTLKLNRTVKNTHKTTIEPKSEGL